MSDNSRIFNKGLVAEKEAKLKEIKVRLKSHKESFDFEYVKNSLHPERYNLSDLRVLMSNIALEIDSYQNVYAEIKDLKS